MYDSSTGEIQLRKRDCCAGYLGAQISCGILQIYHRDNKPEEIGEEIYAL
jgi:hypothetical protein